MEIVLEEQFESEEEAVEALREIARLVERGFVAGVAPAWSLVS